LEARAHCFASARNRRLEQKLRIFGPENPISGGPDVCGRPARVAPAHRWQDVAGNDRNEVSVTVISVSTRVDEKAHTADDDFGPQTTAVGMGSWQAWSSYALED
jgi:hypothetical protein